MNTLKPCPFCPDGGDVQLVTFTDGVDDVVHCHTCDRILKHKIWQTRPIEDDLRKRIAELEALVNVSEGLYERIYEQAARIAELENEHNVWLIGASNAVKNLEARIAELEAAQLVGWLIKFGNVLLNQDGMDNDVVTAAENEWRKLVAEWRER